MVFTGCGCTSNGPANEPDGGRDGALDSGDTGIEASVEDAGLEASTQDAQPGSDCTASVLPCEEILPGELFRLPHPAESFFDSSDWNGRQVAYSESRCPYPDVRRRDVYMFDLDTMQEMEVATKIASQRSVTVNEDSIVYVDLSYNDPDTPGYEYRIELIHYDISTGQETRLTDSNWGKYMPKYNGTHVAYLSWEWNPQDVGGPADLVLRDLGTGQKQMLADHTQNIQRCYDISEDYVTWQAVPIEEPGVWDIFYHHLPSGITHRLNKSTEYLFCPDVSGEKLSWSQATSGSWDVYVLDLVTRVEEQVTAEQPDQVLHQIAGDLLLWFDYRHSGGSFPGTSYDPYLHDLETGVSRRLTAESRYWGVLWPSCQWLVYMEVYDSESVRLFAWDLVVAGVLDASCHVIPCDPQTEQCAMIEWRGL